MTIGRVTISGANAHLLLLALAGDKKFCDNKRIVTISDVMLSWFYCNSTALLFTQLLLKIEHSESKSAGTKTEFDIK